MSYVPLQYFTVVHVFNEHNGQPWTMYITHPPFIIIIIIMFINNFMIVVENSFLKSVISGLETFV